MNTNTYLFFGFVAISIVLVGGAGLYIFGGTSTPVTPSGTENPFPDSRPAVGPNTDTTSVVALKDILKDPATKADPNNPGHYFVGYSVDASVDAPPEAPYIIEYIAQTKFYIVALLKEPIGSVRLEAEQYLMQRLGATQTQMCQLNYSVAVPNSINSLYSGINLGFSFCPGATKLP